MSSNAMLAILLHTIDSGDMCALVLLDLSSAFDAVDHETRPGHDIKLHPHFHCQR